MAIEIKIKQREATRYPILRSYGLHRDNPYGLLVVVFTSEEEGFAISGVPPERIGKTEKWAGHTGPCWNPAYIVAEETNATDA